MAGYELAMLSSYQCICHGYATETCSEETDAALSAVFTRATSMGTSHAML